MKKILLLVIGGILIMTTITGCSSTSNKKSREDIEGLFSDFTAMFPVNNYDFLYSKGVNEFITKNEVGIWNISTYLYTKENEITRIGVNLSFNTQKRECTGNLFITKRVDGQEEKKAYPVYYKDSQILFVDENVDAKVKKSLKEFKMLFEIIDLNQEYLSSLQSTRHYYNYEVPLYGINYTVDKNDKNIKAIKDHYPSLITGDNIKIRFEGTMLPWDNGNGASQTLDIEFDEREKFWFTARLSFTKMKAEEYVVEVE